MKLNVLILIFVALLIGAVLGLLNIKNYLCEDRHIFSLARVTCAPERLPQKVCKPGYACTN